MTISAEVIGDRLEVTFSEIPNQRYRTDMTALICDAASEPYRRLESDCWFRATQRPPLDEVNGRPC